MSNSTWFAESATEWTPSASIDADPVIAAAMNFETPIVRFAPSAVTTARVLPSLAMSASLPNRSIRHPRVSLPYGSVVRSPGPRHFPDRRESVASVQVTFHRYREPGTVRCHPDLGADWK